MYRSKNFKLSWHTASWSDQTRSDLLPTEFEKWTARVPLTPTTGRLVRLRASRRSLIDPTTTARGGRISVVSPPRGRARVVELAPWSGVVLPSQYLATYTATCADHISNIHTHTETEKHTHIQTYRRRRRDEASSHTERQPELFILTVDITTITVEDDYDNNNTSQSLVIIRSR